MGNLQDLSTPAPLPIITLVINLLLSILLTSGFAWFYIRYGRSLSNRPRLAHTLPMLALVTTFIISVVKSSLALSLGLVGALSIVRFRAAIKEPEELAYLFFAVGLGIGLGDNQRLITLLTLAVAIAVIGLMKIFRNTKADVNLHLTLTSTGPNKLTLKQLTNVLEKHCSKVKLLRLDENQTVIEASFMVEFRRAAKLNQTTDALKALSPGIEINFLDNKGIW